MHIDGEYLCIYLPRENINSKVGMIKDIIEKLKPESHKKGIFIPVKHDPAQVPISVKFENIPEAHQIMMAALGKLYNTERDEVFNFFSLLFEILFEKIFRFFFEKF